MVGGTGLYLRAALAELDLRPPPPEGVRERWQAELERRGPGPLHALLAERAPWAAAEIDPNDRQRIVRALELLDLGELEPPEGPSQLWSRELRHPTLLVGLTMEREALYEAIDARVERMVARARARRSCARTRPAPRRRRAGRSASRSCCEGDIERMKQRTRNYAKRQLTWMRKLPDVSTDRRRRARRRRASRRRSSGTPMGGRARDWAVRRRTADPVRGVGPP